MVQSARIDTYLVAVERKREPVRLYALLAESEVEALAVVTAKSADGAHVEVAGRLSRRIAKGLQAQAGRDDPRVAYASEQSVRARRGRLLYQIRNTGLESRMNASR